ncbi:hypothetical protein POTOM_058920 [Populus tomentosa]|uniref:Uncharacterized protein n=1 Tax=Populus tomentosa TaxID=118781 RepID=A0A8X7XV75_POPTO|nr:hypothetical protein POTOM_058920 [Populus tomentosa]
MSFIAQAQTSKEAWTILAYTYAKPSPRADELAILGAPIDIEDLLEIILEGLGAEYKELARAVQTRDTLISFDELHEKLLNFEASLQNINNTTQAYFPASAHLANHSYTYSSSKNIAGHMYRTNFGIGHNIKDLLEAHIPSGGRLGRGHKGFIMTGAFAHGAIFFIRDYNPEQNEDNVLARMLDHKATIISHLSWANLFLGFHTLGLYVHNDFMLAFGTLEKQILIEPIFAQWIQFAHGKTSYGFDVLLSSTNSPAFNAGRSIWLPGWLNAINENNNSLFLTIGLGDFLVHHAIALGLHITTLILVKGALDARGSKWISQFSQLSKAIPEVVLLKHPTTPSQECQTHLATKNTFCYQL